MERLKSWARQLKKYVFVVYLATKDERVPWYTKMLAILVAAYAFSPIDLIPDFIPILGYLDDLLLVPLGVWLVLKMLPEHIWQDLKMKAEEKMSGEKPKNYVVGALIVLFWVVVLLSALYFVIKYWNR